MGASFSAEALKLRKRPATWVLLLILVAAVALFGYIFNYVFTVNTAQQGVPPEIQEQFLQYLLPGSVLVNVVGSLANFGSALALILGALAVGSEYGWETLKTTLTQKPTRLSVFAGKLAAVAVILLVFTLVVLALGAVSSYLIASAEDASVNWPSFRDWLQAIGAGWLILGTFAAMGIFLATLFRGTALAIGLGLVYLLVLENLFIGLATQSDTVQDIGSILPAKNSLDLSESLGNVPQAFAVPGESVDASQAVLVLIAYTVVFLVVAVILFRQRDMA